MRFTTTDEPVEPISFTWARLYNADGKVLFEGPASDEERMAEAVGRHLDEYLGDPRP